MKSAANDPAGTSSKYPVAVGGMYPEPSHVFRRKIAICARVTASPGQ